jgi:hypothetical protein
MYYISMVDYLKKTQKLIKNYFRKKYSKSRSSSKNKKYSNKSKSSNKSHKRRKLRVKN